MKNKVSRLKRRLKAMRRWDARGRRGYFSCKNKEMGVRPGLDAGARARAALQARWMRLEREANANILKGERELERIAA